MLTSLSKRLSQPYQSFLVAKPLLALAGLLSCCNMLHNMSPWTMAPITRPACGGPVSLASSTIAVLLVHCPPASPQRSSLRSTNRVAPVVSKRIKEAHVTWNGILVYTLVKEAHCHLWPPVLLLDPYSTLDAANSWRGPVAVGEPLHRLYIMILNRRLVG